MNCDLYLTKISKGDKRWHFENNVELGLILTEVIRHSSENAKD